MRNLASQPDWLAASRRAGAGLAVPATTIVPLAALDGSVVALADDENLRWAARETGREPDYARIGALLGARFGRAALHVFAVRDLDEPRCAGCRVHVHRRSAPGKNADIDAAIWLMRALEAPPRPSHIVFLTGDVDYLSLAHEVATRGISVAYLCPPGRSTSRHIIRTQRTGVLGADVLVRSPALRVVRGGSPWVG